MDSFSDDLTSSEEEKVYEPPLNEYPANNRIQQSISISEKFTAPSKPCKSMSNVLTDVHEENLVKVACVEA